VICDGQALLKQHGLGASSPPFLSLDAAREKEREEAIYVVVFSKQPYRKPVHGLIPINQGINH
jgi:hypothetical protein